MSEVLFARPRAKVTFGAAKQKMQWPAPECTLLYKGQQSGGSTASDYLPAFFPDESDSSRNTFSADAFRISHTTPVPTEISTTRTGDR